MKKGLMIAAALAGYLALGDAAVFAQQTAATQREQTVTRRRTERRARMAKRFAARFKKIDKNGDGVISRDEWPRKARAFDRIDSNHDGVVSTDELRAVMGARMKRHRR